MGLPASWVSDTCRSIPEPDNFVRQVSFASPDERIGFDQALAAVIALVDMLRAA
jgi:hypothetical protein